MIASWIALPIELRLLLTAIAGVVGGAVANHVIYTFAFFNARPISPWGPPPADTANRRPSDRVPVLGWLGLRRESSAHGRGFWIRPLLIELAMAIALPALYWFETQAGGQLPENFRVPGFLANYEPDATWTFLAHGLLLVLMVAATFVDFDEKTIPDIITIPGTWLALVLAAVNTSIYLPSALPVAAMAEVVLPTTFDLPWLVRPNQWLGDAGLVAGFLIWTLWCFALADRRWSSVLARRRGLSRALRHFVAGLFHYPVWKVLAAMWLVGLATITGVWIVGGSNWVGMFTALMGLAVGGGIVWAIRIVASWAMNMEAMGFGDVTLMAMIGAFVGWQAALAAFFLAPFAAIVIVLVQYLITRDSQVPFGPYLCAGALLTIVFWDDVYNGSLAVNLAVIGPMLLGICVAMLALMAILLFVWRQLKQVLIK